MQHEIKENGLLLDASGNLREPGWARGMKLAYQRKDIRAAGFRIKEWDYYIVNNQDYGIALTIADNAYMGLISASLLDFRSAWEHTETILTAFPFGKFSMPESSENGDAAFINKRLQMVFRKRENERVLSCHFENFHQQKPLDLEITLTQPEMDTMVIATPFSKPKAFYYNQKINCMPASGAAVYDGVTYAFSPENSFGTLDWGRGVWTYDNTWYWGNGNGVVNGKPLGFNIGYGFGDTRAASENMVIYDGVGHKLSGVAFHIPADGYTKPWTFTSDDGRFEMDFMPVLDRASHINALLIESDQHQVFGRFNGSILLDDGTALQLKDFMGFAEKVRNRY